MKVLVYMTLVTFLVDLVCFVSCPLVGYGRKKLTVNTDASDKMEDNLIVLLKRNLMGGWAVVL